MKKTAFLLLCAGTLLSATAVAQNEVDAIRFSRMYHGGTARFSAMGGAFTALGGDASTLTFNPAGIGVYRSSEFSITPNLTYSGATSNFMGNKLADDRYQFGLSNIAGIGVINIDHRGGLTQLNIGFSSNRHNTFSGRTLVQGNSVPEGSSYMAYFASLANNPDPNLGGVASSANNISMEQDLAWYTDLLTRDTITGRFYPFLDSGDFTESRRNTETWGSVREVDFSLGGNISHVFYFGLTVGIRSISYSKDLTDVDEGLGNNTSDYVGFTYNKTYRMSGTGYNFKFGFIARPFAYADFLNGLRIGAAIHTPTFLSMDDSYSSNIGSAFLTDPTSMYASYNGGEFGYALQTPFKCMAGGAYTFGEQGSQWRGIVSMDYEYLNYSKMKMRSNGFSNNYSFRDENRAIATYFKSTHNLRFGGELGFNKLSLRGGYAYYASPYTANAGKNGNTHIASAGIGYRGKHSFIDFAYSRLMQQDNEYLYNSEGRALAGEVVKSASISYDIIQSSFIVTFGVRF